MPVIVAPVTSSRLAAIGAAVWAALAACASSGAIAFSGLPAASGAGAGARIGVLPLDALHLSLAGFVGAIVLGVGLGRDRTDRADLSVADSPARGIRTAIAVSPLLLVLLPWLPCPVPAAFLAWAGGLGSLVWIAAAIAIASVAAPSFDRFPAVTPRRAVLAAGIASVVVFSLAAWRTSPAHPGGDEPHYLIITQSLLYDGDLKIENNHQRGDYRAYFAGDLHPDAIKAGRNGAIYSIHAPGVPAIVLPAFAIGGYRGVVVFLILVMSAACALAWWMAWQATGSMAAAWFGWAAVSLSAPFLLETFTVYPDGLGAAVVLVGFVGLREGLEGGEGIEGAVPSTPSHASIPYFWYGVALALLPWMHTRFAVLAATLGGLMLLRIARTPNPLGKAIAFLAAPALSALAWLFFFTIVYGTPDPSVPYGGTVQNAFAFLPNGLGGVLFDQGFGLLATAPVLIVALVGLTRLRRFTLEWLVVATPYLLSVTTFAMWWAGSSGPARFLVPLLLPLSVPAAVAWAGAKSRGLRAVMLAALLVTAWLSAVMAGGGDGRLGYHTRNMLGLTAAPWLEWASHVVDLPAAFPAFVPQPTQPDPGGLVSRMNAARAGFASALLWAICLGAATLAGVAATRRARRPETVIAALTLTFACAGMIASSIQWRWQDTVPLTVVPAQMNVIRRLASGAETLVDLTSRRLLPPVAISVMRLEVPVRRPGRGTPRGLNRPLAVFPGVPAGSYVVSAQRRGTADGLVIVGLGNDQFAIVTRPIADFDAGVPIELPVGAQELTVRADETARDELTGIELRPMRLDRSAATNAMPRRAVRYDRTVVFFLDERAYPEPSGFWVAGQRDTRVMLAPDRKASSAPLILRNGPVENTVTLEYGGRPDTVVLQAGEERQIEVPLDPVAGTSLVRIRSSAGFRPSAIDPNNRDTRLLGVYVRF